MKFLQSISEIIGLELFVRSWFHAYFLILASKNLFNQVLRFHPWAATYRDYLLRFTGLLKTNNVAYLIK